MSVQTEQGFLVLADVSGFTAFVTATELEHGPPIIAELLEEVIRQLSPPLEIQEVEGDAVFAVGPDGRPGCSAELFDAVDAAAVAFRDRQRTMQAMETCTCNACRNISMLDLKVVVHHGAYLRQTIGGRGQLGGADVILAHRLLKNRVARTGAYLLLTEPARRRMGIDPAAAGLTAHTERYEYLGDVQCFVTDLRGGGPALEPSVLSRGSTNAPAISGCSSIAS